MAVQVQSAQAPTKNTAAQLEPRIVTFEEMESSEVHDAYQHMMVARPVCQWSAADKSPLIQIANPSHHYVNFKRNI